ncbi:MAG: hypothetical protein JSU71_13140 [Betaproteobacteria bacterium]|jgi:hypothetical protein|nr:MAG: hypothetical protein JSU71_13140 [Betaproteobacteria bacterium]
MLSIILSVIAFFAASYFLRRYLDSMDIPKGMTRGTLIFSIALLISYLVALATDHITR